MEVKEMKYAQGKEKRECQAAKGNHDAGGSRSGSSQPYGDFNEWNVNTHPMKKNKRGVWEKAVMLPPGRYEYKFLVDGQWRNDPKNCDYCLNCL